MIDLMAVEVTHGLGWAALDGAVMKRPRETGMDFVIERGLDGSCCDDRRR
jgi:hypothetical protein